MGENLNRIIRCRVDHTASGEDPVELALPIRQLEARHVLEVSEVLAEAEAEAAAGHFVVGFVSYDAAPAFDEVFRVPSPGVNSSTGLGLPLAWFGVFAESRAVDSSGWPSGAEAAPVDDVPRWQCMTDQEDHVGGVEQLRDHIRRGDAYLVNLTTRFHSQWGEDREPFDLYLRLTRHFNDGFHAFIDTTDWTVICGSPELFFELSNGEITTRPMKGTSRRGRWSDEDVLLAERLKHSPKERAENVMVVDMVRNDIGRIAEVGSVDVPSMFDLEVHPSLWQMTSTVTGSCRDEVTVADAFAALFPSASVTGAPKVAAMSLIADLEDAPRSVYCGAVGLLRPSANAGPTGARVDARFAVAIRTALIDKQDSLVEYGSGGGITEGSDPAREWAEVVMKANAVVAAEPPAAIHGLIETMGFYPHAGGGSIRNLDLHLARFRGSAAYFGLAEPSDLERTLAAALKGEIDPLRVRMEVTCQGMCTVTTAPLETSPSEAVQSMCIDLVPVDSSDTLLFHKTMDRHTYDVRAARHPSAHDVVLINERGEVTETTRANLAVLLEGSWWTPPLSSGLLPGIERARLLGSGSLKERVLNVEDLRVAEAVATMSSLRGWRAAVVELDCACDRSKS